MVLKILYHYFVEITIKELSAVYRYKLEFFSGLAFLIVLLSSVYFGVSNISQGVFAKSGSTALLVGFFIMMMTNSAISYAATASSGAISAGNLEFVILFPLPYSIYLTIVSFVKLIISLSTFLTAVLIVSAVTNNYTLFDVKMLYVLLLLIPASFSGIGVGLIISGLIVGHKKAGGVIGIVTMFLSAGVAYGKASEKIFIEMLPMKAYASIAKKMLIEKSTIDWVMHGSLLVASSILYFVVGLFLFHILFKRARFKGNLKSY